MHFSYTTVSRPRQELVVFATRANLQAAVSRRVTRQTIQESLEAKNTGGPHPGGQAQRQSTAGREEQVEPLLA